VDFFLFSREKLELGRLFIVPGELQDESVGIVQDVSAAAIWG
jgi:hypothetical protein